MWFDDDDNPWGVHQPMQAPSRRPAPEWVPGVGQEKLSEAVTSKLLTAKMEGAERQLEYLLKSRTQGMSEEFSALMRKVASRFLSARKRAALKTLEAGQVEGWAYKTVLRSPGPYGWDELTFDHQIVDPKVWGDDEADIIADRAGRFVERARRRQVVKRLMACADEIRSEAGIPVSSGWDATTDNWTVMVENCMVFISGTRDLVGTVDESFEVVYPTNDEIATAVRSAVDAAVYFGDDNPTVGDVVRYLHRPVFARARERGEVVAAGVAAADRILRDAVAAEFA